MVLTKKFWLLQLALWSGFAILTKFIWLDVNTPPWLWVNTYMLLGLLSSTFLALCFGKLQHQPRYRQMLISIALCVLLGLCWRVLFNAFEYHILESANNQFKFWGYFHNGQSAVMQLLIWSAGYWLVLYHLTMEKQLVLQKQLELDAKEANLKMLQYQITPHFLFNVLSGVDTLMLKGDVPTARCMLQKLSDYLRHTLQTEAAACQPLDLEIAQCKRYLEIERMRFKDKLFIDWQLPARLPDNAIPNGVLLPLFENALKHSGLTASEATNIEVKLSQTRECIVLELVNTLGLSNNQADAVVPEGFGIGLSNTRERLQRYFGNKASFSAVQQGDKFCVSLVLNS